jgi:hypothetical protein|tara:strand:- start:3475 stop:4362 length:888 start_codon:yes stop_codon:yes gene_type:complete
MYECKNQSKIKGNSSFSLELVDRSGLVYVRKSSKNKEDSLRLHRQYLKQKNFNSFFNVETATITSSGNKDENFFFEMEFIRSSNSLAYLEACSKEEIDFLLDSILQLLDFNFRKSIFVKIDKQVFFDKAEQVYMNCKKNTFFSHKELELLYKKIYDLIQRTQFSELFPIGPNHGDLTFSNILIKKSQKKVYVIDFLDSFLDSPLQDVVKLRQDTNFFWTPLFHEGSPIDSERIKMVFDYMDNKINDSFRKHHSYRQYYKILQTLNLFRLMPYTKSYKVKNHIDFCLSNILKEATI